MFHRVPGRRLAQLSPLRPWFRTVSRQTLGRDVVAGLTNAAFALPQGVAFAIIAGLPPEFGLFSGIIITAIAAFYGSSGLMVSGPTTAMSALLFATLSEMAMPGTEHYIALAITLTLIVGILQLLAGLTGLGALIAFVSHSVIVGFTAAAAIIIAISQLPGALGLSGVPQGDTPSQLLHVIEMIGEVHWPSLLVAGTTLCLLVGLLHISKRIPAYILALAAGSGLALLLGAETAGIAMFKPLTSVVPGLTLPSVSPGIWSDLLPGASALSFVGLLGAISIGRSFAYRRGERYDANQEIVGQGLSNVMGSFLQCYTGSGSFTRSGLNIESGAATAMSSIFAAVFLFAGLLILAPLAQYIPIPAMSAVVLFVAWKLIDKPMIRHIFASERSEIVILAASFFSGLLVGLDFSIYVGVVISLAVFLRHSAHPVVASGAPTMRNGRKVFVNTELHAVPECPQIRTVRIGGPLFFGSIEAVEEEFSRIMARAPAATDILLSLKGVGKIDLSGADFLIKLARKIEASGHKLHLIVANPAMLHDLGRLQVTQIVGADYMHTHKTDAVAAAVHEADDDICARCSARIFHECQLKKGADTKHGAAPERSPF